MPLANGSGTRIALVPETVFGTTPANPTFQVLRMTGAGIRSNKTTGTSEEIRRDRNVTDEFLRGVDVAGDNNFEFSYGSQDDLLAAALFSSWNTDVLVNGITPKSFTYEETLELGPTDSFSRFTGVMVSQLSLDVQARAAVTGSVSFMGQKETLGTAALAGATYTDPNANKVETASGSIAALNVADVPNVAVRRVQIQVANNLRTRPVVGSLYTEEFGFGVIDVTGTIEAYFASNALYQKVLDHGGGALAFTIGTVADQKYTFTLPKIIFQSGERTQRNNTSDVMLTLPFRAVLDGTTGGSLKIERAVA
ncbi:phage tail tube protein [Ancylobacter oerskovii]|uniref:Phage tail tube protein n=1 Tax=Ancylobacter oerskovii TaxID=459519 RepID=A0ABW4Z108_9HYPH|nr:phage tail tube protein [Ancylobacter oerskovii]MBS7542526.1 phage tail protein [Ancylobacter oerskovii]